MIARYHDIIYIHPNLCEWWHITRMDIAMLNTALLVLTIGQMAQKPDHKLADIRHYLMLF